MEEIEEEMQPKAMFSLTREKLLVKALNGEFSLEHMARYRLYAAGIDCQTAKWIGFDRAGEQLRTWERANVPPEQWLVK